VSLDKCQIEVGELNGKGSQIFLVPNDYNVVINNSETNIGYNVSKFSFCLNNIWNIPFNVYIKKNYIKYNNKLFRDMTRFVLDFTVPVKILSPETSLRLGVWTLFNDSVISFIRKDETDIKVTRLLIPKGPSFQMSYSANAEGEFYIEDGRLIMPSVLSNFKISSQGSKTWINGKVPCNSILFRLERPNNLVIGPNSNQILAVTFDQANNSQDIDVFLLYLITSNINPVQENGLCTIQIMDYMEILCLLGKVTSLKFPSITNLLVCLDYSLPFHQFPL